MATAEECAVEIERDCAPEFFVWHIGDRAVVIGGTAGVVVQDIEFPELLRAAATAAATLSLSVTSVRMKIASPPLFPAALLATSAVVLPAASSISETMTLAPSSTYRIAVARPIPPPPPVTNATFPSNLFIAVLRFISLHSYLRRNAIVCRVYFGLASAEIRRTNALGE